MDTIHNQNMGNESSIQTAKNKNLEVESSTLINQDNQNNSNINETANPHNVLIENDAGTSQNSMCSPTVPIISSFSTVNSKPYVHPLIEIIDKHLSENEIIDYIDSYIGSEIVGTDSNGNPIYDTPQDQLESFPAVMQLFSYCANNGKKNVVEHLMKIYVPLQVSYSDNFCYFETQRMSYAEINKMIVEHCSFIPSTSVLQKMYNDMKYDLIRTSMNSLHLNGLLRTYKYTILKYLDEKNYIQLFNLLQDIHSKEINDEFVINHKIEIEPSLEHPSKIMDNPLSYQLENENETTIDITSLNIVEDTPGEIMMTINPSENILDLPNDSLEQNIDPN